MNSSIDWILFVGFILSEISSAPLRPTWQFLPCLLCWGCACSCDDAVYHDYDDANNNYDDYDDGNNNYDDYDDGTNDYDDCDDANNNYDDYDDGNIIYDYYDGCGRTFDGIDDAYYDDFDDSNNDCDDYDDVINNYDDYDGCGRTLPELLPSESSSPRMLSLLRPPCVLHSVLSGFKNKKPQYFFFKSPKFQ